MTLTGASHDVGLTPDDFDLIRTILNRQAAIQVNDGQEYLVEHRLVSVIHQCGLASISEVADAIRMGDQKIIALTVDAMTTNETSFFRDKHPFDAISEVLIPELCQTGKSEPIVIWCAACSSGQEPYSLAMLLSEKFPDRVAAAGFQIVATDLSPKMIERCRQGRYSQFEITRGLAAPRLTRHFEQEKRDWVINPKLRSLINFQEHNLTASWNGLPRCDIVLIRNVLIYFTVQVKAHLLARVRNDVLKSGGALILGSTETTINIDDTFQPEEHGQATVYRAVRRTHHASSEVNVTPAPGKAETHRSRTQAGVVERARECLMGVPTLFMTAISSAPVRTTATSFRISSGSSLTIDGHGMHTLHPTGMITRPTSPASFARTSQISMPSVIDHQVR